MKKFIYGICGLAALLGLAGCLTLGEDEPPPQSVSHVDIDAFMGRWYVIATTPGIRHRQSHDALKDLQQLDDGTIEIKSYQRSGEPDAEWILHEGTARIRNIRTNAEWEITYNWPLRHDYRILHVSDSYDLTILGDDKRNNVRLLAREPHIADHRYSDMMMQIQSAGYDISKVRRVPHNP